ncbi:MAG: sigma-70 family RNA polymerase sigma factor [Planctomycetaceae bacterium]
MLNESEITIAMTDSAVVHRSEQIVQSRRLLLCIAERLMSDALRTQSTASDVVQQTLLSAIRDQDSFRGSTHQELTQWLIQILKHRIIDEARRIEMRRMHATRTLNEASSTRQPFDQPTVLSDLVAQETIESLLRAIEHLDEQQQAIVRLRYIESLSFESIGKQLDLSHDAVRRLWLKAMQSLGRQLGTESGE